MPGRPRSSASDPYAALLDAHCARCRWCGAWTWQLDRVCPPCRAAFGPFDPTTTRAAVS